jgi:hypothetical protein
VSKRKGEEQMITFKRTATLSLVASSLLLENTAQSALFDRGNGLIYDDVLNATWAADANLFQTQASGNANLVADIIAANNGVIHDTPNGFDTIANSGTYTLSNGEFTPVWGPMDWWGAQAWIVYLNKTSYKGYNNWSLPTTVPGTEGFNKTGSQMGELFYNELGGVAVTDSPIRSTYNANYNLFTNVQNSKYWSGSEYAPNPVGAWFFYTGAGWQSADTKLNQFSAMAVRPGDVAAVPVPAALWLFGSGLSILAFNHRRKNIQLQYC